MWLFFSGIMILVYTGLCVYIGLRLLAFIRFFLPGCSALVYWPLFALLAYSFILINLLRLDRLHFLRQFGVYFMAVFVYLLLSLLAFDLLRLALWFAKRGVLSPRFSAAGFGAALCVTMLVIIYGVSHARSIYTSNYRVNIAKSGTDMRIALISDLHIGATVDRAWIARIVDKVNQTEPDMVCIAGDIFDSNLGIVEDMSGIAAELRRLNARNGVYACLGNHDVDRVRLLQGEGSTEGIANFLRDANIILLTDEALPVADNLYIAGRRDARPIGMQQARISAAELVAALEANTRSGESPFGRNTTLIMLDHQPIEFPQIEKAGVDLLLCGHTHRGQLFPANLATRSMYKRAGATHYGYWQGTTMQAVVTSGAGLWGPPLRVATNSEVAVIELVRE
ncbi:serine/threonine protein phosphatase [Spirochaetia bacterium]|nr:serine/threonine protein phosphatase [Spirochaetia bacterium]